MNRLTKTIILATAALATVAASLDFAAAQDRDAYWRHHHNHHFRNGALAAGVIGLAAGAIIGDALASDPEVVYEPRPIRRPPPPIIVDEGPVYDAPVVRYEGPVDPDDAPLVEDEYTTSGRNRDYFPNRPAARNTRDYAGQGTLEPWSPQWRAYCAQRYQSFNPRTGTYRGYDSQNHFCIAG